MSEQAVKQERTLSGVFQSIEVSVISVVVEVGAANEGVSLRGEAHVLDQIETRISGDTLVLGPKSGASFSTSVPVEILFSVSDLGRAEASAGARVSIEGLFGKSFEAFAASGAQIVLEGEVIGLVAKAESGGMIDISRLGAVNISSQASSGGMIRS